MASPPQCFPGCLTIRIRTVLCIFIVVLIYAVAQACVVSGAGRGPRHPLGAGGPGCPGSQGEHSGRTVFYR